MHNFCWETGEKSLCFLRPFFLSLGLQINLDGLLQDIQLLKMAFFNQKSSNEHFWVKNGKKISIIFLLNIHRMARGQEFSYKLDDAK